MNVPACHDNPLHAKYYPDQALQCTVEIIENVRLARATFRVRFACPEVARRVVAQNRRLRVDRQGREPWSHDADRGGVGARV